MKQLFRRNLSRRLKRKAELSLEKKKPPTTSTCNSPETGRAKEIDQSINQSKNNLAKSLSKKIDMSTGLPCSCEPTPPFLP